MNWHKVADPGELAEGALKQVIANGKTLVLAHNQGRFNALDSRCPHAGGPLAEGSIENGMLTCPWHGREFDLRTGKCEAFAVAIGTYPVEVRADGVYVEA